MRPPGPFSLGRVIASSGTSLLSKPSSLSLGTTLCSPDGCETGGGTAETGENYCSLNLENPSRQASEQSWEPLKLRYTILWTLETSKHHLINTEASEHHLVIPWSFGTFLWTLEDSEHYLVNTEASEHHPVNPWNFEKLLTLKALEHSCEPLKIQNTILRTLEASKHHFVNPWSFVSLVIPPKTIPRNLKPMSREASNHYPRICDTPRRQYIHCDKPTPSGYTVVYPRFRLPWNTLVRQDTRYTYLSLKKKTIKHAIKYTQTRSEPGH